VSSWSSRRPKASIASKETDKKNKEADLEQTKIKIEEDLNDLKKNQELLDAALKELEELRPACVDTGMTYEERVAAREKEIEALKKALEILQPAA
jgi:chromosome segregation ATPase